MSREAIFYSWLNKHGGIAFIIIFFSQEFTLGLFPLKGKKSWQRGWFSGRIPWVKDVTFHGGFHHDSNGYPNCKFNEKVIIPRALVGMG